MNYVSCSGLADETGKTITVEGEGVVAGDSDMLRRAFSNLLSNAIKYSPITPVQRYTLSVTVTV
jgi:signal transduction histidine kinase